MTHVNTFVSLIFFVLLDAFVSWMFCMLFKMFVSLMFCIHVFMSRRYTVNINVLLCFQATRQKENRLQQSVLSKPYPYWHCILYATVWYELITDPNKIVMVWCWDQVVTSSGSFMVRGSNDNTVLTRLLSVALRGLGCYRRSCFCYLRQFLLLSFIRHHNDGAGKRGSIERNQTVQLWLVIISSNYD